MQSELASHFGLSSEGALPSQQSFLIEHHSPMDATFLTLQFSALYLKSGRNATILSLTGHNPSHYLTAASKLALNFTHLQKQHNCTFSIEDLSTDLVNAILQQPDDKTNANIFDRVRPKFDRFMDPNAESADSLIVLDGVHVLVDLGLDNCQVFHLVQKLLVWAEKRSNCVLIITDAVDDRNLMVSLQHVVDHRITLQPVGAGFAKDVTGTMFIRSGRNHLPDKQLHFLLTDRRASLFHPGCVPPRL